MYGDPIMLATYKQTPCPEIVVNHDNNDEGLLIEAALPGIARDDLFFTVVDSHFCLSGDGDDRNRAISLGGLFFVEGQRYKKF
jgi:HSP20 family molecular chaperone IbpA